MNDDFFDENKRPMPIAIFILLGFIQICLILLKLFIVEWSWWIILTPVWVPCLLIVGISIFCIVFADKFMLH